MMQAARKEADATVQTTQAMAFALVLCGALPHAVARAGCDPQHFPIAVDIGHTPEQPGATSARGIPEFAFNMALGRDTVAALEKAGFPAQRIVVSGGGGEQLSRRVAQAKALSPALVISVHHNSVQERYLEDWRFAGQPRKYADRFSGFSLFVSGANAQYEESLAFARALGRSLNASGFRHSTHHAEKIPGENRAIHRPAKRRLPVPQPAGPEGEHCTRRAAGGGDHRQPRGGTGACLPRTAAAHGKRHHAGRDRDVRPAQHGPGADR